MLVLHSRHMEDALTDAVRPEDALPPEEPKKRKSYEYQSPEWDERYRRVVEVMPKLAAFRDWFMENRYDPTKKKVALRNLVDSFNEAMTDPVDRDFWPNPKFLKRHCDIWDKELLERNAAARQIGLLRTEISKQLAVGDEAAARIAIELVPTEESTERKMRTLGDFLLDDAMDEMSQAAEELGPESDSELMLKRKKYALNVYSTVVKTVQRDKELALKMKAEDRESAGFMLNLINSAIAGKLTPEMIALMNGSINPELPIRNVIDATPNAA